jgi:hypothetical protein
MEFATTSLFSVKMIAVSANGGTRNPYVQKSSLVCRKNMKHFD